MQRPVALAALLMGALVCALYARIDAQERALREPSGGSGTIEAVSTDVASRIGGRITAIEVREGAEVHAGDVVARIDCAEPAARLVEADARVAQAEAQVLAARAQVDVARRSRGAAAANVGVTDASAALLATRQGSAERELERIGRLGEYAPTQRRDAAQDQVRALEHEESAARARRRASWEQARMAAAQTDAAAASVASAEGLLDAVRAARELVRLTTEECVLRAPVDGTVDQTFYVRGEVIPPGATLVRLVDLREVTATFYLPNNELSAVASNRAARVVADAWPGRSFVGEVVTVATTAEFTPRTAQTRTDRDRLVYPIEVRLANPELLLRPGMPVQVTLPGSAR